MTRLSRVRQQALQMRRRLDQGINYYGMTCDGINQYNADVHLFRRLNSQLANESEGPIRANFTEIAPHLYVDDE